MFGNGNSPLGNSHRGCKTQGRAYNDGVLHQGPPQAVSVGTVVPDRHIPWSSPSSSPGVGTAGLLCKERLLPQILGSCSSSVSSIRQDTPPSTSALSEQLRPTSVGISLPVVVRRHLGDQERKLLGHVDAREELLDDVGLAVGEARR